MATLSPGQFIMKADPLSRPRHPSSPSDGPLPNTDLQRWASSTFVPDHVPDKLARTDFTPQARIIHGGTGAAQDIGNRTLKHLSKNNMLNNVTVIPSHAPTQEDFNDMKPALKEGPVKGR